MEISQLSFVLLAVYSLCFGVVLGVIYDIMRVQRVLLGAEYRGNKSKVDYRNIKLPIIKKKAYSEKFDRFFKSFLNIYIAVGDVLFVTACGAAVVLVAYAYNSGRVRVIIYLGLLFGFLAYYFTVGKIVMRLSQLIAFVVRSILVYCYEIISAPIRFGVEKIKKRSCNVDIKRRRKYDKREKQKLGA